MDEKKKNPPVLWTEIKKNVVVITLNRPERCNALSYEALRALTVALRELENHPKTRVLIFTGNGRHFCGGLDLREAFEGGRVPWARNEAFDFFGETIPESLLLGESAADFQKKETVFIPKSFQMPRLVVEILYRLLRLPQIVIGAATGGAFGGGGGILSACDLTVADETFLLGFPENRRGLTPSLLHPFLTRKLTSGVLARLLLTGAPSHAEEARRMGIIQEIVPAQPADSLFRRAEEIANAVGNGEPEEIIKTKRLLNAERIPPPREIVEGLIRHWQSWTSPKAQEGIAAFLEKRSPAWQVSHSSIE